MARFHRGNDGWGRDSYQIPEYAIAGSSCTGDWPDSPAKTSDVKAELGALRKELRKVHIRSRLRGTRSGNVFMTKVWVVVSRADYATANEIAKAYLAQHENDTRLIHDAV